MEYGQRGICGLIVNVKHCAALPRSLPTIWGSVSMWKGPKSGEPRLEKQGSGAAQSER
jgi:hypothetical protein